MATKKETVESQTTNASTQPKKEAIKRKPTPQQAKRLEEAKRIMADYHSGDEAKKQQAQIDMIRMLDGYVNKTISDIAPTFHGKDIHDEFVSECHLAILEHMGQYDPEKGQPSTYFLNHLKHAITQMANSLTNRDTQHFSKQANLVRKAQNDLAQKGVNPTPDVIAIQTGQTLKNVMDGLKIITASNEVHFDTEQNFDAMTRKREEIPETSAMEEETKEIWRRAFSKLTPDEEKAFLLYYGIETGKKRSYNQVAKELGKNPKEVSSMIERARRVLQRDETLKEYYSHNQQRQQNKMGMGTITTLPEPEDYDDSIEF